MQGAINLGKNIKDAGGLRGILGKPGTQDPQVRTNANNKVAATQAVVAQQIQHPGFTGIDPKKLMKSSNPVAERFEGPTGLPEDYKVANPDPKEDLKDPKGGGLKAFVLKLWWKGLPTWKKAALIGVPTLIIGFIVWKATRKRKKRW